MPTTAATDRELRDALKALLVETLRLEAVKPEDIGDEDALFSKESTLKLDSLSALELLSAVEFQYKVRFENDVSVKQHFASIATLAAFVGANRG